MNKYAIKGINNKSFYNTRFVDGSLSALRKEAAP